MNNFLYDITSEIVLLLRKNNKKLYVFIGILACSLIVSLFFAFRNSTCPYVKRGLFSELVVGKGKAFGYFFYLIVWNVLTFVIMLFCSCNVIMFKLWPGVLFIRLILKFSDVICTLRFFFFTCFMSALICIVTEIVLASLLYLIYLELSEKHFTVLCVGDLELLKDFAVPLSVAAIIVTGFQAIMVNLFIF